MSFDVVHLSVNCVVNNFILFGTGVEIKILMGVIAKIISLEDCLNRFYTLRMICIVLSVCHIHT